MTKQPSQYKKLEALIQRAIESGWNKFGEYKMWSIRFFEDPIQPRFAFTQTVSTIRGDRTDYSHQFTVSDLILDHDFARALFGEERYINDLGASDIDLHILTSMAKKAMWTSDEWPPVFEGMSWQYHLQQAILSDDPIDYMYKEVFG